MVMPIGPQQSSRDNGLVDTATNRHGEGLLLANGVEGKNRRVDWDGQATRDAKDLGSVCGYLWPNVCDGSSEELVDGFWWGGRKCEGRVVEVPNSAGVGASADAVVAGETADHGGGVPLTTQEPNVVAFLCVVHQPWVHCFHWVDVACAVRELGLWVQLRVQRNSCTKWTDPS